jgi:hypothetical protein
MRTGYNDLPQGTVLSPIMYNFYMRLVKACFHLLCSILQYADELVVYISGRHVEAFREYLLDVFDKTDDLVWGPGSFIVCKQVINYGFCHET